MDASLLRFLERRPGTTLDTCDPAQIDLAGTIQKGNGLLVLHSDDHMVVETSENIEQFLNLHVDAALGLPLDAISSKIVQQVTAVEHQAHITHKLLDA